MTLEQLAQELALEHGERQGDTGFISQLVTWIKNDLVRISLKSKFKLLWKDNPITTAIDDPEYELPTDFKDFKYIRFQDNDDIITYLSPRRLARYNLDFEQKGKPKFAWIVNATVIAGVVRGRLRFQPIPNAEYLIDAPYYYYPTGLTSSSDIPVNEELILLLKSRLSMHVARIDRDWDLHNAHRADFNEDLKDIRKQENTSSNRDLVRGQTDIPRNSGRPYKRFRYPFEIIIFTFGGLWQLFKQLTDIMC